MEAPQGGMGSQSESRPAPYSEKQRKMLCPAPLGIQHLTKFRFGEVLSVSVQDGIYKHP